MHIITIVLIAIGVFFGTGLLLLIAMFVETRKNALPDHVPNPEKAGNPRQNHAA
jgi:hypothetical protein